MPQTISDEYLRLQQELHRSADYGQAGAAYAAIVAKLVGLTKAKSISDFGAGKQGLKTALAERHGLAVEYSAYDPAFPEYGEPRPADLVCCIDVLEHIEPDYLDTVLDQLAAITVRFGFFTVHTGPAIKQLSDGRNAHLIQEDEAWWLPRFEQRFRVRETGPMPQGFYVLVSPAEPKG